MRELPTGTVTFLFSDIEGSTRMLRELGRDGFGPLQDEHSAVIRDAIADGDGVEIRTEGDAFFAVFPTATGALAAAAQAQRGLAAHPWPGDATIRVRIGLHTGEGVLGGDDYLGIDVNKAARIASTGHGGQTVISSTTAALVAGALPTGVRLRDLGSHVLKDFDHPEQLHDVVLDGADAEFPPLRTADPRRIVLPAPRSSFVGRETALAEIAELVGSNRLTTLTGPGGTGKTRLAIEVASAVRHRFADGVYFVDLSAETEPEAIVAEVARVLRVREAPDVDPSVALRGHLRDRRLLLVLDNFEQLVRGSEAVGDLLDDAPGLTALATSRIALRLAGEAEYPVPPLALPHDGRGRAELDALASVESIRLFLARAEEARPGFRLDETNADAIVEIVQRLDAVPLAIELAAARLRVLDPATLAARLDHRLSLLTGGPRDAPERHRTLAASIRWSEESLDDEPRALFRDLSIFVGGWTLEAAEIVCADDTDVLDGLTALVESSLVRRSDEDPGELRFEMLETIREYSSELLADADPATRRGLERRHSELFRALAEESEPHLTGDRQLEWLARLGREHDNLRAVLDRAERTGDPADVEDALLTAGAIWRFWQQRGHLREAHARLMRLLALPAASPRNAARVRALGALGAVEYWLTDYATMIVRYDEATEIARELGDARLLSHALFDQSFGWFRTGDIQGAIAPLEECLAVAEEEDIALRARAIMSIGYSRLFQQDFVGGRPKLEEAIELFRATGERMSLCEAIVSLSALDWLTGDTARALAELDEATRMVAAAPTPLLLAGVILPHELVATFQERFHDAAKLHGMWEGIQEEYDVNFPVEARMFFGGSEHATEDALGPEAYAKAIAQGRSMTVAELFAMIAPTSS